MTVDDLPRPATVGLVAGGGRLPFAVGESLRARGITPVFFALKGFCDPVEVAHHRHHWIALGQIGRLMSLLRREGIRDLMFIGTLTRPALSEIRLDWGTMKVIRHVLASFRGGDDHLLSGISSIFERDGFRLLGLREMAPDLLMPEGQLSRVSPDRAAEADIAIGREVLHDLSRFDIGQACVVIDGHVVAVEGIEGTDAMLARVASLREQKRIRAAAGRGVLVKMPKRNQDLRLDLPAFGPVTVENAAKAQLAGVAIAAGHAILAEPQRMVEVADAANMFVAGVHL